MKIETIRHSLSHIMALAIQELYPKTKFGIGPAIENGFYYDFDFDTKLREKEHETTRISSENLPKIEERMKALLKKDIKFVRKEVSKGEAKKIFKEQPYKLELIDEIEEKNVTIYESGDFTDLCAGPHIESSKEIPVEGFKLTKIAGAYWKGNEKNPMLTRIYGVAFENKERLEEFLKMQEEAEKRDHRKLGVEFDLFSQNDLVGAGLILWHPKLSIVREEIERYWREEHRKRGYQYVYTPHIGKEILWQTSGHTSFYKDLMYPPLKDERNDIYYVKPMNCPFHMLIYNSRPRSYRDLPMRLGELGTVYRYELEGVRHGIMRPRGFTQDDAHIICTKEQLVPELEGVLDFAIEMNAAFGLKKLHYELSIRDPQKKEKHIGKDQNWNIAEQTLKEILDKRGIKYQTGVGEAKFYGPAIDLKAEDALGRLWQGTTIQFDFNLPEKFNMEYTDGKGKKCVPYMIHRTLLGSLERFIGVLIEHYAGAFPLWLAPEQIWVIPVGSAHRKYAREVGEELGAKSIRVVVKDEAETVSKKIRNGEIQKIPYMLVVGDKEMETQSVRTRQREKGDIGIIKLTDFIENITGEVREKT